VCNLKEGNPNSRNLARGGECNEGKEGSARKKVQGGECKEGIPVRSLQLKERGSATARRGVQGKNARKGVQGVCNKECNK
jgi:hypothetical protein